MLHVDERRHAALLLRFGDHLQGDGGFARGFRTVDFADAPARKSANAQRRIDRDRAGRDDRNRNNGLLRSQPQNRAFAELFLDLAEGKLQGARSFFVFHDGETPSAGAVKLNYTVALNRRSCLGKAAGPAKSGHGRCKSKEWRM